MESDYKSIKTEIKTENLCNEDDIRDEIDDVNIDADGTMLKNDIKTEPNDFYNVDIEERFIKTEIDVGNIKKESVYGGEANVNLNFDFSANEKDPLEVTTCKARVKREKIEEDETLDCKDSITVSKEEFTSDERCYESEEFCEYVKNEITTCSSSENRNNIGE